MKIAPVMLKEARNPWESGAWPSDLAAGVGRWGLARLALEAVMRTEESELGRRMVLAHSTPSQGRMFLTLLAYCYAAGIYGSEDIEQAVETDEVVRYLSARDNPGWMQLRRFRRQNRWLLQLVLANLLEMAFDRGCVAGEGNQRVNGPRCGGVGLARKPIEPGLGHFLSEADRRIYRAIQSDSMAMDQ